MAATFKVEKTKDFTVMSNNHLRNKNLSLKAKGLQSLMLSLPDTWNYTLKGLISICKDGQSSVTSALKELEDFGYLRRVRLHDKTGKFAGWQYIVYETPYLENPNMDNPNTVKPNLGNPNLEKQLQSNTNKLKTNIYNTKSINHSTNNEHQRENVENYTGVVESIKEQIDYDLLLQKNIDCSRLDEIVNIMAEVKMSNKDYKICGHNIPYNLIHNVYDKIDYDCIIYVIDNVDEYSKRNKICNIKGYLMTALYNAPLTINTHYSAECNYDMENSFTYTEGDS